MSPASPSRSIDSARAERLADVRAAVAAIEAGPLGVGTILPFGAPAIDAMLPGGGIATAALHEAAAADASLAADAAATVFLAGVAARLEGTVLWCRRAADLFAPGLAQAGLHPDRVIHAELRSDADILAAMEEGLRAPGLAAVVGEVRRLGLAQSRRLQLACEAGGVTALVQRRARADDGEEGGAATTRWRVAPAPSAPLPLPTGLGRSRWRLVLARVRGGVPGEWIVEACDGEGRLSVVPDAADRSAAPVRAVA